MKSVVVLQARTNSTRLPGKVLLPVGGLPLVVLAALRASNKGRSVLVATSEELSDDNLVSILNKYAISVARGSLNDPLGRIVNAISAYGDDDLIFRLTADNVFPDGELLEAMEHDFISRKLEYLCCNGVGSGLPYGVSVELTYVKHLREAAHCSTENYDREHVTPYIVRKFGVKHFQKYAHVQLGAYRCTVDCLDDYLGVASVFNAFENPVSAGLFDLCEKLSNITFAPLTNKSASKLVFGAAQLGLAYGIANTTGRPNLDVSIDLLKTAISNGVTFLDTARAYGDSESVIGAVWEQGWSGRAKLVTKLSPLAGCPKDASEAVVKAFVDASVFQSCSELLVKRLDILMLHRASHLSDWGGAVWRRLLELQSIGLITELGVSVQTPDELSSVLQLSEVSHIQMPYNILDWRWDDAISAIQKEKSVRRLTVHVRSALLQGLLTSSNPSHWKSAGLEDFSAVVHWLENKAKSLNCSSVVNLCLNYVRSLPWVDGVVVGMENKQQLVSNVELFGSDLFTQDELREALISRPAIDANSLNPSTWKIQND